MLEHTGLNKGENMAESNLNTRKCIVEGSTKEKKSLLRFAATKENVVVPDFDKKHKGRGFWISNSKAVLKKAIEKNIFSKVARKKVAADQSLLEQTHDMLSDKALQAFSFLTPSDFEVAENSDSVFGSDILCFVVPKDVDLKMSGEHANTDVFSCFSAQELEKIVGKNVPFLALKNTNTAQTVYNMLKKFDTFSASQDEK